MPRTRELVLMNVVSMLQDELGFAGSEITDETSLADLGVDALDLAEIFEVYDMTVSAEDAAALGTIRALVDLIVADAGP
jgi:acyl carrier protein